MARRFSSRIALRGHARIGAAEVDRCARRADAELRAQRRVQRQDETLVALAMDPSLQEGDFDATLGKLTEAAARTLGVERVGLWSPDESGQKLVCRHLYERSTNAHSEGEELDLADYPMYFAALESARSIAVRNARLDPRTREYTQKYLQPLDISSMLDVPVRVGGRRVAILCHEQLGAVRAWTEDERAFAASIADLVTLAYEARERARAQRELGAALGLLGATLEATADGVLVTDLTGRATRYSRKLLQLWGMQEELVGVCENGSALGAMLAKLSSPEQVAARLRAFYAAPESSGLDVFETKCGRLLECHSQPQRLEGRVVGRVFSFRDVTARALAERERDALVERDRERREAAELFAEASAVLGESLDYEQNLGRLAHLFVRSFSDWCYVAALDDGKLRVLASAHRNRLDDARLDLIRRGRPVSPASTAARVIRTGNPMLMPEVDESVRSIAEQDPFADIARELGVRSLLAVPALARGRVVAALVFHTGPRGRSFGAKDLAVAFELARRVGNAIDIGQLHRQTDAAAQMRGEFVSLAAHELRTPVASLLLALEALRRAAATLGVDAEPRLRRLLEVPERQAQRLGRLVDTLLEVSRLDAAPLSLDKERFDLLALVNEVTARMELELARAQCIVTIRGDPTVGTWDRARLEQVLTNLLSNALRYGAGRPIEMVVGESEGLATFAISDHGMGVPPDRLERIFGRFERVASRDHYPGLGLGLYLARAIVQAHGGSITCTSELGVGSTFSFEIPRET